MLCLADFSTGDASIAPSSDFDALALEVLVDGEEVGDLLEHVGIDLGEVPDILVARIILAYAEHLLVGDALVEHLQQADGANLHDAAGEAGCVDEDECVERIAVVGERAGDESVVARVMDRRIEVAVQPEDVELLVVLVLVDALMGNFDDGIDDIGRLGPNGEFKVVRHNVRDLFSCTKVQALAVGCWFGPEGLLCRRPQPGGRTKAAPCL